MAKYANKSNGRSFLPLENRVAPMIIKLAETLERSVGGQLGSDGADSKQAMMKIAKQIKKSSEAAIDKRRR